MGRTLVAATVALLAAWVAPALAAEGEWQRGEAAAFRLISMPSPEDPAVVMYGVQVRPDRGWKLFWRAPGVFGIPPSFDTSRSRNLGPVTVLWPMPRRLTIDGDVTAIGYDREVVFPLLLRRTRPHEDADLELAVEYGICRDSCIAGTVTMSQRTPARETPSASTSEALARARASVPGTAPATLEAGARREGEDLIVELRDPGGFDKPDIFVDAGPGRGFAGPKREVSRDGRHAIFRLTLDPLSQAGFPDEISFVLADGARKYEVKAPISAP